MHLNRNGAIIIGFLVANLAFAVVADTSLLHALELSFFQAFAVGVTALFYEREISAIKENLPKEE